MSVTKLACAVSATPHTEPIPERVAAEGDGRAPIAFEFLLTFRAGVHSFRKKRCEILHVEIDVNRRPVPLMAPDVVGSHGRFASGRFLEQADFGIAAFENGVGRHRPGNLGQSQRSR
jgi:hypothetical protein